MEITRSQELIKSILIMAGIPLAFSVTCSLFTRFKEKKISSLQDQIQETNSGDVNYLKEHIFTLKCKIEELQELEREIEVRFFKFIELKDQEHALMVVQNGLCMEKERAEFLEREVSSMEEQNKKFDEMVVEYLNALEELESLRSENKVVRRKGKKILKKNKESLRLIVKQKLKIEAQDKKMLSNEVELKRKDVVIEGFEREVDVMRAEIHRLENEKNEALNKLETKNEVVSKAEVERILTENYNQVVKELESIKKDRANELKELIYLRWCHACLRHELARRKELEQQTEHDEEIVANNHEQGPGLSQNTGPEECKGHESDNENVVHHAEPFFGPSQQHTKRRWLVRKFKKWVEGNEKRHDSKCFRSHSVVDTEERREAGRKSFSSV